MWQQQCWRKFCINSLFSFSSALLNCRWSFVHFFTVSVDDLFLCFESIYDVSFIVPHLFGCFLCCSLYNTPFLFFDWSVKCANHLKTYKPIMEYKIWMASNWKNSMSQTFLCSCRHQPSPASFGFFFKDFSTCSEINDLTVLLLNTNCIESVVQTLDNQMFHLQKGQVLVFLIARTHLASRFASSWYKPDMGLVAGEGRVGVCGLLKSWAALISPAAG